MGVSVYAKNFGHVPLWQPGTVQELKGPVSYTVEIEGSRVFRRHVDHVRAWTTTDGALW